MCVQNFDDSRSPAIRITYRISLRSSSLREPRHPSLKVVYIHILDGESHTQSHYHTVIGRLVDPFWLLVMFFALVLGGRQACCLLPWW